MRTKEKEFESAKRDVQKLVNEYFSLKYDVAPGDEVYSLEEDPRTKRRYKLKIVNYELWTDNLDATPDIIARTIFPFGESTERKVKGRHWSPDAPDDWGTKKEGPFS